LLFRPVFDSWGCGFYNATMKLKPKAPLLIVLTVAFIVRLIYLIEYLGSPFFDHPVIDSATYLSRAAEIAAGKLLPDGPFWQAPLYEYWLGLQYAIFGENFLAFRLVAIIIGCLTVWLVYRIARQIAGEKAGIVSGLFYAIYGTAIFYEMELLPVGLAAFCWSAFIYLFIEATENGGRSRALAAGAVGGIAALTATTGAIALPPLFAYLFFRQRAVFTTRVAGLSLLLMTLGTVLPIALTAAVNYSVSGEPIIISHNAGINYYIGNNADAEGTMAIRPGEEWYRLTSEPTRHGATTARERQRYFFQKSFDWAAENPGGWLRLQLKKIYRALHGFESARNIDPYLERNESMMLWALLWNWPIFFPWGLLLPLAFLALVAADRKRQAPVLIFLVGYLLGVALFFVAARHRLPVAPMLCVLGGASFVGLHAWGKKTRLWFKVSVLLAMHALAVAVNLPVDYNEQENIARREYLLGQITYEDGEFAKASEHYSRAVELADDFASAYNGRGMVFAELDNAADAEHDFIRALELMPDYAEAGANLGALLLKGGTDLAAAVGYLQNAQRADPWLEGIDYKLAVGFLKQGKATLALVALARIPLEERTNDYAFLMAEARSLAGDTEQAVEDYLDLLGKRPGDATLLVGLAAAYRKGSDFVRARVALDRVLAREPENYNALYQLADLERGENNCKRALEIYRRLLETKADAGLHNNIGICLVELGEYRQALAALDEALKLNPSLVRTLINKGSMHRYFGEDQQAKESWQRALELDPLNTIARSLIDQVGTE
jgi:tetratricopeptide (TPR) repeat protein